MYFSNAKCLFRFFVVSRFPKQHGNPPKNRTPPRPLPPQNGITVATQLPFRIFRPLVIPCLGGWGGRGVCRAALPKSTEQHPPNSESTEPHWKFSGAYGGSALRTVFKKQQPMVPDVFFKKQPQCRTPISSTEFPVGFSRFRVRWMLLSRFPRLKTTSH